MVSVTYSGESQKHIALDDYDLSQSDETGNDATDGTSASLYNLFNNRMNVVKVCGGTAPDDCDEDEQWGPSNEDDLELSTDEVFGYDENYTFFFNDGIVFSFPANASGCTEGDAIDVESKCYGVIDVNGAKNPNKAVVCDDGDPHSDDCTVTNPTDIYPVVMYDQSILPNSVAAQKVMYSGK